jgi:hypothetical protein
MKAKLTEIALLFIAFNLAGQDLPQPNIVIPAYNQNPPSDAIILFNEGSLDQFESVKGGPAKWTINDDHFTVQPGAGNIHTKEYFGDMQLHIEWRTPAEDTVKEGQKNGNSGIYIMGKYEVQVLNSYQNETYPDGQAGAIYKQHPPMVNASRAPGEWQIYDIIFRAPRNQDDGAEKESARLTVFHNGILIQYHAKIKGPTIAYNKNLPENALTGPLMLQDHSNKVSYRNIWLRELEL